MGIIAFQLRLKPSVGFKIYARVASLIQVIAWLVGITITCPNVDDKLVIAELLNSVENASEAKFMCARTRWWSLDGHPCRA